MTDTLPRPPLPRPIDAGEDAARAASGDAPSAGQVATGKAGTTVGTTAHRRDDLVRMTLQALQVPPTAVVELPASDGITGDWPDWAHPTVVAAIQAQGIARLWRHQQQAAQAASEGRHVVLATSTASGKSVAYWLPALSAALGERATTLYCTVTKALAQDQQARLARLDLTGVNPACYDGDTDRELRPWIRRSSRYVLTNPDMLHRSILPGHAQWRPFLRRLRYVVLDESHAYRGIFGANVAAVVARLRRLCALAGSDPTFILSSATLGDPTGSAAQLLGVPAESVVAIAEDTSARGSRTVVLVDPSTPLRDRTEGQDRTGGRDRTDGQDRTERDDRTEREDRKHREEEREKEGAHRADRRDSEHREGHVGRERQQAGDGGNDDVDDPLPPPSAFAVTTSVLAEWARTGVRSVGFLRSRAGVEAMAAHVRAMTGDLPDTSVTAYRGGLLPEERRDIERGLRSGELRCVASTNALELGVDIAGLDAVAMCGWPGTRLSFLQQLGRAGRTGDHAVAVLAAQADPLDRYYAHHPERLFGSPVEAAVLDRSNPYVLVGHVACAVAEQPLSDAEGTVTFGPAFASVVTVLAERGLVRRRGDRWFWVARAPAHQLSDLRGAGQQVTIIEADTGRVMGTVDGSSAPAQLHAGAVYTHLGVTHLIESLDLADGIAVARPARPGYTTTAQTVSDLRIRGESAARRQGAATLHFGEVEVTSQVVGYLKRASGTGRVLGSEPLEMPRQRLVTRAVWWRIAERAVLAAGMPATHIPGAAHAAEHAAIGVLPALATCDRWDIGGLSTALHPDTGEITVFVYDGHPGGAGFARRAYDRADEWLTATRNVIASCDCATGCPGCVQSPKCGNGNEPLDKSGALAMLGLL